MTVIRTKRDAAAMGAAIATGHASKPPKRRGTMRWPEQRDAFAKCGVTASMLRTWLECEYLRARGLRSGCARLRADELARIMSEAPITASVLAEAMAPRDVRRQAVLPFTDKDGAA